MAEFFYLTFHKKLYKVICSQQLILIRVNVPFSVGIEMGHLLTMVLVRLLSHGVALSHKVLLSLREISSKDFVTYRGR